MEIRQLTAGDAPSYQVLRLFALQETPTAFGRSYEEEADRSLDLVAGRLEAENAHVFGAFDEQGRLIGMAALTREPRPKSYHKAYVFQMYVTPEARTQGTGRALLNAIIDRAHALNVRQLNLSVAEANRPAVALYESAGFQTYGVEKDAMKIGEEYFDVLHMSLRLGGSA